MIALDPAVKVYVVLVFVFALHVVLQLALETLAPERLHDVALVHVRVAVSLDVVAIGAVRAGHDHGRLVLEPQVPARQAGMRTEIHGLVADGVHESAVGARRDHARDVVLARLRAHPRVRGVLPILRARRVVRVAAPDGSVDKVFLGLVARRETGEPPAQRVRIFSERVSEREVLRRRGRVHETEDRRVSVQRDEALAELDVGKRVSYDARLI
mmetsp:Transcript_7918/g.22201  ORF Transcript_7918/g.22201 Transcript_7918/m.22201 type:complete len:213 (-) Transcript_7918:1654-2292(-)